MLNQMQDFPSQLTEDYGSQIVGNTSCPSLMAFAQMLFGPEELSHALVASKTVAHGMSRSCKLLSCLRASTAAVPHLIPSSSIGKACHGTHHIVDCIMLLYTFLLSLNDLLSLGPSVVMTVCLPPFLSSSWLLLSLPATSTLPFSVFPVSAVTDSLVVFNPPVCKVVCSKGFSKLHLCGTFCHSCSPCALPRLIQTI